MSKEQHIIATKQSLDSVKKEIKRAHEKEPNNLILLTVEPRWLTYWENWVKINHKTFGKCLRILIA